MNLRKLAMNATPGPWMRLFGERTVYDRMEDGCRGNAVVRTDYHPPTGKNVDNLDFIAAANPATILAMIALIEQQHEALKDCMDYWVSQYRTDYENGKVLKYKEALAAYEEFNK